MMITLFKIFRTWLWQKKVFSEETDEQQENSLKCKVNHLQEIFEKYTRASYSNRKYYRTKLDDATADVILASLNLLRFNKYKELVDTKMMVLRIKEEHKRDKS